MWPQKSEAGIILEAVKTLAILCGGHSRRFETDKGLFIPNPQDRPLFLRMVENLEQCFTRFLIIVRDIEQRELYATALDQQCSASLRPRITIIEDTPSADASPAAINGVLSGLVMVDEPWLAVAAVDQLALRAIHFNELTHNLDDGDGRPAVFADDDADGILPFPAIWPRAAIDRIRSLITAGALSVTGALRELNVKAVPAGDFQDELRINCNQRQDLYEYLGNGIQDKFGRRLSYLRFSLTEVCNLSCQYCLPDGSPDWKRQRARIKMEDIQAVLKGFRQLGFQKVRFTGGEPTVHNKCLEAIDYARKLGFEKICMTTNGLLMTNMREWARAGLTQVNFSLDSIDEEEFFRITKSRDVKTIIDNIECAISLGLVVKINAVLMRNYNWGSVDRLIDWALERPVTLRFIELMPMELNRGFDKEERILNSELVPKLAGLGMVEVSHGERRITDGPEALWSRPGLKGKIGLISPLSCNFCDRCNRLRVTSRGALKLCLFGDNDIPLDLSSGDAVAAGVVKAIEVKPERHHLEERNWGNVATFRTIGG
jgi:cyclic pyranopterin phosphate synthase